MPITPPAALIALALTAFAAVAAAQLQNPPTTAPALDPDTQKSMIAHAQGRALLQAGKPEQAVERFKRAITLRPDDGSYRYSLADAYGRLGKLQNRWFQLRQAVRLRPDLTPAVQDFTVMWDTAVARGLLDVGASPEDIVKGIGEPDLIDQQGSVTTRQYGFMTINFQQDRLVSVMDLRTVGSYQPPRRVFVLDVDQQHWRLKYQLISGAAHRYEFLVGDDPAADPDGLVTLERSIGAGRAPAAARALMTQMRDSLEARYPDLQWTEIEVQDDDVLFEWRLQGAAEAAPTQHEITRLTGDGRDLHRLAYTAGAIGDRDAWLQRWRSATLESADPDAAPSSAD